MLSCRVLATLVVLSTLLPGVGAQEVSLVDPTILLVRDEGVRAALACTPEQRRGLDDLLRRHNRVLLAIRDVGPSGADETAHPTIREIRAHLQKLLSKEQQARLQGLTLQAQGYDALLRRDIGAAVELTEKQQSELADLGTRFRNQVQQLRQKGGDGLAEELKTLQAERHKEVVALLTPRQEETYGGLLGEPFDFSQAVSSPAWAPEFEGITEWIESKPLTMQRLAGKVVVVHFFAFGCGNCVNNYPWYREWHAAFEGQDFVLIGIHTPETAAEEDVGELRASLQSHQLSFPVAVDNEKTMWKAWSNGVWPSVYIIDRQGRLRYWWYGELDWQGAGNQRVARKQIEQLLAEGVAKSP